MGRATVSAITAADLGRVGVFLHQNLNARVSSQAWADAARVPWSVDAPNHGFMLLDGDDVVGVYLAFYSDRTVNGQTERFCNLGAWCVLPAHRLHSITLLRALLGQPGYHFTDLSPSGNTVPVNARLKFNRLDTATALLPNLPWPSWPGQCRITSDPVAIERILTGRAAADLRGPSRRSGSASRRDDQGGEQCYVIFRRDRRKNLPLFASVLYVSNPPLFRSMARVFGRHLLMRHGVIVTLMELRVCGGQPVGSFLLRSSRPKMFKKRLPVAGADRQPLQRARMRRLVRPQSALQLQCRGGAATQDRPCVVNFIIWSRTRPAAGPTRRPSRTGTPRSPTPSSGKRCSK